jgi:uncharacterized membrane protein YphA (DoxX/SURF4 family)
MSIAAKLRRTPPRLATGAFILNSGLKKWRGDEATAKAVHGMAVGSFSPFASMEPTRFLRLLAVSEIGVGAALLLPIVPPAVAGAALTGFSGSLLKLYWDTPGMHEPGDPRPTQQGVPMAKDVWMFGIGLGLVLDAVLSRKPADG